MHKEFLYVQHIMHRTWKANINEVQNKYTTNLIEQEYNWLMEAHNFEEFERDLHQAYP